MNNAETLLLRSDALGIESQEPWATRGKEPRDSTVQAAAKSGIEGGSKGSDTDGLVAPVQNCAPTQAMELMHMHICTHEHTHNTNTHRANNITERIWRILNTKWQS